MSQGELLKSVLTQLAELKVANEMNERVPTQNIGVPGPSVGGDMFGGEALAGLEADPASVPTMSTRVFSDDLGHLVGPRDRTLAFDMVKNRRPEKKFSGTAKCDVDFEKHMKGFVDAMKLPGVTAIMRLQELPFWFDGPAHVIVDMFTLREDAGAAIEEAIRMLRKKWGMKRASAFEMLGEVLSGEKISPDDAESLLMFWARLNSLYSLAVETGRAQDFERSQVFNSLLETKIPHLSGEWWAMQSIRHGKGGSDLSFSDFLEFIDIKHNALYLLNRSRASVKASSNVRTGAKIHAVSADVLGMSSEGRGEGQVALANKFVKAAGTSIPTQACVVCSSYHSLQNCEAFVALDVNVRADLLARHALCFRCLTFGHMAREGPVVTICGECGNNHNSLLHGRRRVTPRTGAFRTTLAPSTPSTYPLISTVPPPLTVPVNPALKPSAPLFPSAPVVVPGGSDSA